MKRQELSGEQIRKILEYQDRMIDIASRVLEANEQKLLNEQLTYQEVEAILESNVSMRTIQQHAHETLVELASRQESSVDWKAELEKGFRMVVATIFRVGVNKLEHMDIDAIIKFIHDQLS